MAVYTDNFNRGDENPLAAPWSKLTGMNVTMVLASNRAATSTGGNAGYLYDSGTLQGDQYAQAYSPSGTYMGLVVRGTNLAADTYYLAWCPSSAGSGGQMYYFNGSTHVGIGNFTTNLGAAGRTMRFEAEGTALRVYLDNVLQTTQSHSTLTSGRGGIAPYNGYADDFEMGDLAAAVFNPAWALSSNVIL